MVRLIKLVLYIFYKYYRTGNYKDIAFTTSIGSFLTMILLSYGVLMGIFKINIPNLIPATFTDQKIQDYVNAGVIFVVCYLFMYLFFKEDDIKSMSYSERTLAIGQFLVVLYIIITFISIVILAFV